MARTPEQIAENRRRYEDHIDSEGQQAVDALLYCADDHAERYSAQDTLRVQSSAYPQVNSPCNGFNPTPIRVEIHDAPGL